MHSTRREWQDNLCLYNDKVHDPAGAYDDAPPYSDTDSDTYLLLYHHLVCNSIPMENTAALITI